MRLAATIALLALIFVAVPELLGDWPYDPRPTTWTHITHYEHV